MYGFVNGTNTLKSMNVCSAAILNMVDAAFIMIDNRFVWLPQYTVKFQQSQNQFTDFSNTAYAYCNFSQLYMVLTSFLEPGSDAFGRMISRIAGSMMGEWWYKTNCIVDGFLGENYYDIGYCMGNLVIVVFDFTLGG